MIDKNKSTPRSRKYSMKGWNYLFACVGLLAAWAMTPKKGEEKKCLTTHQELVQLERGKASRRW